MLYTHILSAKRDIDNFNHFTNSSFCGLRQVNENIFICERCSQKAVEGFISVGKKRLFASGYFIHVRVKKKQLLSVGWFVKTPF